MKRIARSAIVECSVEAFFAMVEDIEAYPSFLPWCAAAQAAKVEFTLEYEFSSRIADSTVEAFARRAAARTHG